MIRDLLRPKALLSHVLVLAVAVTCIVLGNWQLSRLAEVRAYNALLAERLEAPALELADLVGPDAGGVDDESLEFRSVTATGVFRPQEEVLQRNREHQGQQGFHLLTPLELEGGEVVLIRRGWVPATYSEPPVTVATPPDGAVTVTGILERPVSQPGFGARDPDEGHLDRVFHTDTDRLDRQVEGELFPMVLRLETQDPPLTDGPGEFPLTIASPQLDEANHLSYALQWFSFAGIALITYGAWLWSRRRRGDGDGNDGTDDHRTDEPQPAARL